MEQLLKELISIPGPCGYEHKVIEYLKNRIENEVDELHVNGLGTLIAVKRGGNPGPTVAVSAHTDEVGFIVRAITADGFIKFSRCGFFFITGVLSQHFTILTDNGPVDAICALGPGMFDEKFPDMDKLVMDVGCTSKEEVKALGIQVGDFIVPCANFKQVGPEKKHLINKAWDNRIGCAVSLRVMEKLKNEGHPNTFIGGGTVQEEVGTRGAKTLGYMSHADIGFSIDVGTADDMYGGDKEGISLGKGPELCVMDSYTISNRKLLKFAVQVAEECNIPYQVSIMKRGGTDASEFQHAYAGMPVLLVNVPSRYVHTPTSMIHYDDYINTVKLMSEIIKRVDQDKVN